MHERSQDHIRVKEEILMNGGRRPSHQIHPNKVATTTLDKEFE